MRGFLSVAESIDRKLSAQSSEPGMTVSERMVLDGEHSDSGTGIDLEEEGSCTYIT